MKTPSPAAGTDESNPPTPAPGGGTLRARGRRPYRRPRLVAYGDVRDLTFGMTPGMGDSGNPALFKPQGL